MLPRPPTIRTRHGRGWGASRARRRPPGQSGRGRRNQGMGLSRCAARGSPRESRRPAPGGWPARVRRSAPAPVPALRPHRCHRGQARTGMAYQKNPSSEGTMPNRSPRPQYSPKWSGSTGEATLPRRAKYGVSRAAVGTPGPATDHAVHAVGPYRQAAVGRRGLDMAGNPADGRGHGGIEQPQQVNPRNTEHLPGVDGNPRLTPGVSDRRAAKDRACRARLFQDPQPRQRPLGVGPHPQRGADGGQFRSLFVNGHVEPRWVQEAASASPAIPPPTIEIASMGTILLLL